MHVPLCEYCPVSTRPRPAVRVTSGSVYGTHLRKKSDAHCYKINTTSQPSASDYTRSFCIENEETLKI